MPRLLSALEAYKYYCSRKPKTKREREFKVYAIAKSKEDIQTELDAMIAYIREQITRESTQELLIVSFKDQVTKVLETHSHEETV